MARVAHIPYLEKRPTGYFFRRRFPTRLKEISNHKHGSAICLSIRTDVLSEAKTLARSLTALSDRAFALMLERPVDHLSAQDVDLLTELARFQIAAHEATRAMAAPRSEEAANFAAASERASQDILKRAIALGDRSQAVAPMRAVAVRLGVTLNETSTEWHALAFEALRVMLDVAQERERREIGTYQHATPVFRSVMARAQNAINPTVSPESLSATSCVPKAVQSAATIFVPQITVAQPTPALPTSITSSAAQEAQHESTIITAPSGELYSPEQDEKALRIKMRPPLLDNIDIRHLSEKTQKVLEEKPRGILLSEAIQLMWELKTRGYGDNFAVTQEAVKEAGSRWKTNSSSKGNFAAKYWIEFIGDVQFEDATTQDIRDALELLPQVPNKHSKGTDQFVVKHGYKELVERIDADEFRTAQSAIKTLETRVNCTVADREKAELGAKIARLRAETIAKHRGYINSIGKMLYDLQLIDKNPFAICSVPNSVKKEWQKNEASRARTCWDDRIYKLFETPVFQGGLEDAGDPMFWIPLIARLQGLREEEACQLGPDDFGTDKGIAYFDIKRLDGNNVKTGDSERRLPVHPTLIALGFLKLVEMRRRQDQRRLFPNMTRGQTKQKFSENFSKNFTYYRQTNDCYWPGLDLHAMRTTFHCDLMNRDKSDAIRCKLMGHDPVDEGVRSYAQGLSLATLYERICDVELDISMITSPFHECNNSATARGQMLNIRAV
ncbi:hypothetical protein GLP59_07085 [Sulfitobacter sp. M220]|uniref:DUF6538 domain-containing protein n=1 Tax=Sulfitobacter sp. M220 TaxID=2675333 RepID=UPI001F23269D|nr:DUF6538 domain-containing protein [Sulfitobacter sp. M220]MCF7777414.1 hypothetical protein [Sulfitobacter sp. M220]